MRFCEAGPYDAHQTIVTVGGGLKTSQLLYALNYFYFGGVRVDEGITDERFPSGDGPVKLVACMPHYFSSLGAGCRPNSAVIPPFGKLLEEMARTRTEFATFETAFKYFLTDPGVCQRNSLLLWVSPDRTDNSVEVVWAMPGSEAPGVWLTTHRKADPLPDRAFFLTERPIYTEPD